MLRQAFMGDDRAVDDRLPDRNDICRELADGREVEVGQMPGDEIGPELGHLLVRQAARHVDEVLLEAVFLENALESAVANEDGIVALGPQALGDPHAVQGRSEGGLRIEDDRFFPGHDFPVASRAGYRPRWGNWPAPGRAVKRRRRFPLPPPRPTREKPRPPSRYSLGPRA